MMQPIYYETNSVLHRLNPLSKIIATVPLFVFLNLITDIWTPLTFIVLNIVLLLVLGHIPPLRLVRVIAPFLLTFVGFLVFYPLFVSSTVVAGSPLLFHIGAVQVRLAGVLFGLAISLRILSVLVVMLMFVLTTDASDFMRALVQQWRVNYRLGYVVMAAYRFIPLLESELHIIQAAHKVRGVSDRKGVLAQYERFRRSIIPLLASAVRSAERKALAMDARAFGVFATRTYYHRLRFTLRDWLFITTYWLLSGAVIGLLLWKERFV